MTTHYYDTHNARSPHGYLRLSFSVTLHAQYVIIVSTGRTMFWIVLRVLYGISKLTNNILCMRLFDMLLEII